MKAPNFLDNLTGVTISAGSTGVGSSSKITICGESSFTNNNPLFVVDGIVINNRTIVNRVDAAANGFMEIDFGNGGTEINPDDIVSVPVLKGLSAGINDNISYSYGPKHFGLHFSGPRRWLQTLPDERHLGFVPWSRESEALFYPCPIGLFLPKESTLRY